MTEQQRDKLKGIARRIRVARQHLWAAQYQTFSSFRLGYMTALDDIDRTGLRPMSDKAKREAADRALKRLAES